MKSLKLAVVAMILIGIFGVGNAMAAADSADIAVSATIEDSCRIDQIGDLGFGSLDPLQAADQTLVPLTVPFEVTCTNGTNYKITDNASANPLISGGNNIVYSLVYDTGTLNGTGTSQTHDLTGTMLAGAYVNKPVGSYTATAIVTVTPEP